MRTNVVLSRYKAQARSVCAVWTYTLHKNHSIRLLVFVGPEFLFVLTFIIREEVSQTVALPLGLFKVHPGGFSGSQ